MNMAGMTSMTFLTAILRNSHGVQQVLHSHPAGEQIIEHVAGSGIILTGIQDGIAIIGDARWPGVFVRSSLLPRHNGRLRPGGMWSAA